MSSLDALDEYEKQYHKQSKLRRQLKIAAGYVSKQAEKIKRLTERLEAAEKAIEAISEVPWRFRSKKTNEALAAYAKTREEQSE